MDVQHELATAAQVARAKMGVVLQGGAPHRSVQQVVGQQHRRGSNLQREEGGMGFVTGPTQRL